MTKQEWIARYEKKAEPFEVQEGEEVVFSPEKGIFVWKPLDEETIYIDHSSVNDIAWLMGKAREITLREGRKRFATITKRNPVAFQRLTKAHFLPADSRMAYDGTWYWAFEMVVK